MVDALQELLAERQDHVLRLEARAKEEAAIRRRLEALSQEQEALTLRLSALIGPPDSQAATNADADAAEAP